MGTARGHGIVVVAGPPCAGKSSVARLLARDSSRSDIVVIEVDTLFSALLPHSDRNRSDRMLAYDAAHAVARVAWVRDRTPVLECTYARLEQRASLVMALADIPEAPWLRRVRPPDRLGNLVVRVERSPLVHGRLSCKAFDQDVAVEATREFVATSEVEHLSF